MHKIIAISEIKQRAEAIGLSVSALAVKAGISPSTVTRQAVGITQNGWIPTNQKLVLALEAEEERVRTHLRNLEGAA